jgi:signal transduction histidine kinase
MEQLIRRWRQLGIWLPTGFVAAVSAVAILVVGPFLSDLGMVLLIVALTALGATAFSIWVFRVLAVAQRETQEQARRLSAIDEASLALSSDLDLASVLQRVVELSREVTDARYGALAMLNEEGQIAEFLTSGISREERERIGQLPEGKGLLGAVIRQGKTLRVARMADHPLSAGFPPHHPMMTSFIGLPIVYEGRLLGDLYLTDKNAGEPFTERDEETLRTFAAHAAIAIENARLYRQVQDLVLLEERERIGMDLHDGVIQSLYATGLRLESCLEDLEHDPSQSRAQLNRAIDALNQTIADIRSYIFHLQPALLADSDLAAAVGGLLQELNVNTLMDVRLIEEPDACRGLSSEQLAALFHVAREAVTNVRKHAQATGVAARLEQQDGVFRMTITDDGVGFDPARPGGGLGLRNIQERVAALNGWLEIQSAGGQGTRLTVEVRLAKEGERG